MKVVEVVLKVPARFIVGGALSGPGHCAYLTSKMCKSYNGVDTGGVRG